MEKEAFFVVHLLLPRTLPPPTSQGIDRHQSRHRHRRRRVAARASRPRSGKKVSDTSIDSMLGGGGGSSLDAWFKRAAQKVQDTAREAAEKAGDAAKRFATDVRVNTKATADAAEKTFKRVVTRVETLRDESDVRDEEERDRRERETYGITNELLEFLDSMTMQTFRDFPLQDDKMDDENESQDKRSATFLSEWQEKHAIAVLKASPRLNNFRYRLVPQKMTDRRFWNVYFQITISFLKGYPKEVSKNEEEDSTSPSPADNANHVADGVGGKKSVINTDPDLEAYLQDVLGEMESAKESCSDGGKEDGELHLDEGKDSGDAELDEDLDMESLEKLLNEVDVGEDLDGDRPETRLEE